MPSVLSNLTTPAVVALSAVTPDNEVVTGLAAITSIPSLPRVRLVAAPEIEYAKGPLLEKSKRRRRMLCDASTRTAVRCAAPQTIGSVPSFSGAEPPTQLVGLVQLEFTPSPDQTTSAPKRAIAMPAINARAITQRDRVRNFILNFFAQAAGCRKGKPLQGDGDA